MKAALSGLNEERAGEERAIARSSPAAVRGHRQRSPHRQRDHEPQGNDPAAAVADRAPRARSRRGSGCAHRASMSNWISARNEHSGYEDGMTRLRSELSAAEAECASLREQHSEECESSRGMEEQTRRHSESPADHRRPCRSSRLQHGVRSAILQLCARARLGAAGHPRRFHRSRFPVRSHRRGFPASGTAVRCREGSRSGVRSAQRS